MSETCRWIVADAVPSCQRNVWAFSGAKVSGVFAFVYNTARMKHLYLLTYAGAENKTLAFLMDIAGNHNKY